MSASPDKVVGVYIVLGGFLDGISVMVLTFPTVLPIIESLGFDRI